MCRLKGDLPVTRTLKFEFSVIKKRKKIRLTELTDSNNTTMLEIAITSLIVFCENFQPNNSFSRVRNVRELFKIITRFLSNVLFSETRVSNSVRFLSSYRTGSIENLNFILFFPHFSTSSVYNFLNLQFWRCILF